MEQLTTFTRITCVFQVWYTCSYEVSVKNFITGVGMSKLQICLFSGSSFDNVSVNPSFRVESSGHGIIELVDSISRDGTDIPVLYVIHYKHPNISKEIAL